jgi:hypothetical protein
MTNAQMTKRARIFPVCHSGFRFWTFFRHSDFVISHFFQEPLGGSMAPAMNLAPLAGPEN